MTSIKNEAGIQLPLAFTFNASNQQVRTTIIDDQPYFCGKDVCACLGLSNHNDALSALDDDERRGSPLPTPSGIQQMTVVNESGLYHLIFQSRKAEAKVFRKWVTSEVLPALRKTGRYEVCKAQPMRWSQRYVRPTSWLDLRNEPYETKMLYGGSVRVIVNEDVEWYSMGDVLRALGVATSAFQSAAMLNQGGRNLACKIHIFGNTHPAWFTTLTGVRLLACGSRKYMRLHDSIR